MKKECTKCFKQHSARNRDLCKACFDLLPSNMTSTSTSIPNILTDTMNQFSQNTNSSTSQSHLHGLLPQQQQHQQIMVNNGSNGYNNNFTNPFPGLHNSQSSSYSMFTSDPTQMSTRRRTMDSQPVNLNNPSPPLSSINVDQLTNIINACINPVKEEIQEVKNLLTEKVTVLENKVNLLEKENEQLKEGNSVLTGIVVNMQSSLNRMENEGRSQNLIISRIPEGDMQGDDDVLHDDKAKVSYVMRKLNLESVDFCDNMSVERIGRVNPGKTRFVKVKLPSKDVRNDVLNKKGILKTLEEPLKQIFIKKDLHPVYQKENERLYKKMVDLKKDAANEGKEIKITNGKLLIDSVEVDKNTFLV